MKHNDYRDEQIKLQIAWRKKQDAISKANGEYLGKEKEFIVPKKEWEKTIWKEIQKDLIDYLKRERIKQHSGAHDLLSSWTLCSNLYFGTRAKEEFKELFHQFIEKKLNINIDKISEIGLEFVPGKRSQPNILGEPGGIKQTTPDVFADCSSNNDEVLIVFESKYTEKDFGYCFGKGKIINPNPQDCDKINTIKNGCLFNAKDTKRKRKYWDYLGFSDDGLKKLKKCPASTGGYQLVRQQALAEGILKEGRYKREINQEWKNKKYENVWSCVAYDG